MPSNVPPNTGSNEKLTLLNRVNTQLKELVLKIETDLEQNRSKTLDPERIVSITFAIKSQISNIDQYTQDSDEEVKKLAEAIKENIRKILTLNDNVTRDRHAALPSTKAEILELIKKNDAITLNTFRDHYGAANKKELMGYAFRVAAAGGKIDCLRALSKYRCNYFLIPGDASDKLPIHFAAENGHVDAIRLLLQVPNSDDYFASYQQLTHGSKGRRAIDFMINHPDAKRKEEMLDAVSKVLNSNPAHLYIADEEDVEEVQQLLSANLHANTCRPR